MLVPAAIAARNDTINVKVVRAAIAGLYECVLSEYIKDETRETLQEDLGLEIGGDRSQVRAALGQGPRTHTGALRRSSTAQGGEGRPR